MLLHANNVHNVSQNTNLMDSMFTELFKENKSTVSFQTVKSSQLAKVTKTYYRRSCVLGQHFAMLIDIDNMLNGYWRQRFGTIPTYDIYTKLEENNNLNSWQCNTHLVAYVQKPFFDGPVFLLVTGLARAVPSHSFLATS